jgi:hypothetical protein
MKWNNVKPSRVYGRRARVEKALMGSGWKIGEFRPPRDGERVLGVSVDDELQPTVVVDARMFGEAPRFILVPGEFTTWWE